MRINALQTVIEHGIKNILLTHFVGQTKKRTLNSDNRSMRLIHMLEAFYTTHKSPASRYLSSNVSTHDDSSRVCLFGAFSSLCSLLYEVDWQATV